MYHQSTPFDEWLGCWVILNIVRACPSTHRSDLHETVFHGLSGFGRNISLTNATTAIDASLVPPAPTVPTLPTATPGSSPLDTLPVLDLDTDPSGVGFTLTETQMATPVDTALLAAGDATGVRSNNFAELSTNAGPLGQGSFNGLLSTEQISTLSVGYSVPVSTTTVPGQVPTLSPAFSSLLF